MEFAMKRMNRNMLLAGLGATGLFLFTPSVAAQTGIYVLNGAAEAEFAGTVNVRTSDIYINSVNAKAFDVFGDASVKARSANVVGGITNADNFAGTLNLGVAATPDPLASLPTPTWDPAADLGTVDFVNGDWRLSPGFYSGGISLSGSVRVFLDPGLYILDGEGLRVTAGAEIRGIGVTLFITGEGSVTMTGTGTVDLSPTFGGVYDDILLFVDRANASEVNFSGGSEFRTNGKMYAPSSRVVIIGNSDTGGNPRFGFVLICDTLRLSGTGELDFLRLPSPSECFD